MAIGSEIDFIDLKITHSSLASMTGTAQGYSQGWPGLVQQIKSFVEK